MVDGEITDLNETQPTNTNQHTTISSNNNLDGGSTHAASLIGSARENTKTHELLSASPAPRTGVHEQPLTTGRKTSATRRHPSEALSPAGPHLKLPTIVDSTSSVSPGPAQSKLHEVYLRPMLNKKMIERKREKGVEMFATHLKHKEVEF